MICPNCGTDVETMLIRGRRRIVTTTVIHYKKGTTKVCHAILKTKETPRDRTP